MKVKFTDAFPIPLPPRDSPDAEDHRVERAGELAGTSMSTCPVRLRIRLIRVRSWNSVGGAVMDVGWYPIHGLGTVGAVGGGEPSVVLATIVEGEDIPGTDATVEADLVYPSDMSAQFTTSIQVPEMNFSMRITGSAGEAFAHNFCVSSIDYGMDISVDGQSRTEEMGKRPSYTYQLEAFADHVRNDAPIHSDVDDALVQAEFIDAVYTAAGLPLRPTSTI
jgi:Predicted dehydrogenases and related proteins